MRLSVSEVMAATGADGDIRNFASLSLAGVESDSRKAGPDQLFACLPGARVDGHDFAAKAVLAGARAVLCSRPMPELTDKAAVLTVGDVLLALGRLARFWRRRTRARVAAVSGSAGKTTVKDLLAQVAVRLAPAVKNPGNWNNQLGLPLSMLKAEETDRIWVLELGISRPGDMEALGALCEPDLVVVHNIGPAHLEGLKDLAGVAKAKASLFGFLRQGGLGLASMDYPELWAEAQANFPQVLGMSTRDPGARFYGEYLGADSHGLGKYHLALDGLDLELTLPFVGSHLAENVLAAASAAKLLGATLKDISAGLMGAELPEGRFQVRQQAGWTLIDDTYNANPLSMGRALAAVGEMAGDKPVVLVLGEMAELGGQAEEAHQELGRLAGNSGCRAFYFRGCLAAEVEKGLAEAGYAGRYECVEDPGAFVKSLMDLGLGSAVILFKGSRRTRMEEFLEGFQAALAEKRG
jgi:UDP-N-acetylmuramoyl-tripeptide--D-alanyl-D-alanine ligase